MALYTMKEILADAGRRGYGVGFFNAINMEMVRAYIAAAEENRSPVIIGTSEELSGITPFAWIVPLMLEQARAARVPVAVHLDHTYSFHVLMQALRCGFGSVMFDGSREVCHEDNVRKSAEIVRIAHAMGVDVECELGSVGGLSDETGREDAMVYTEPGDAAAFVADTGADFLAVSIGTAHGVYKAKPKLDMLRLQAIRERVEVPLVLHGGSGLSDEDFQNTIAGGICKVNVYTDIITAGRDSHARNGAASYHEQVTASIQAMKEATARKMRIFGSVGRA